MDCHMDAQLERHPQNVEGPFYVENGLCMGCGAPESEANGLMSHDATGHCFFVLQPTSSEEVDSAIRATWASCCGAIRYGGDDPTIITRLAELGEAFLCDERVSASIKSVHRNQVRFEYRDDSNAVVHQISRFIVRLMATSLHRDNSECTGFQYEADSSSFQHVWGKSKSLNDNKGYSIRIRIKHENSSWWRLSLSENEQAETGTAIQVDKALRESSFIHSVRWFSTGELSTDGECGRPHPY
jgi:hypothetical protein